MKSGKIVRVVLKNPVLRRVRQNFRDVIEFATKQEISRLFTVSCEYRKKSRRPIHPSEKKRLEQKEAYFSRKSVKLSNSLLKSVNQCGLGGGCSSLSRRIINNKHSIYRPTNLDMVWVPSENSWFCIKCSEILIEGDRLLRQEHHPDYIRQLKNRGLL